jgi:hypothetical protein
MFNFINSHFFKYINFSNYTAKLILLVFLCTNYSLVNIEFFSSLENFNIKNVLFLLIFTVYFLFFKKNLVQIYSDLNLIFLTILLLIHSVFFLFSGFDFNQMISYYFTPVLCFLTLKYFSLNKYNLTSFKYFFFVLVFTLILFTIYSEDYYQNIKNVKSSFLSIFDFFDISTPYNQKNVFFLLSLITLIFIYNNCKIYFYLIPIILITYYLISFSNTYSKIAVILIYILIFFKKYFYKKKFISIFFLIFFLVFGPFFYNNYTVKKIHGLTTSIQKYYHVKIEKNMIIDCQENSGLAYVPDFYQETSLNKHQFINLRPIKCFSNDYDLRVFRHHEYSDLGNHKYFFNDKFLPVFTYDLIGYFSRTNQLNQYYKIIRNEFPRSVLIGINPKSYKNLIVSGNFTHNSILNIFTKYGLIFVIFIILILYKLMINNYYHFVLIIIFMTTQMFDDYLIGNRIEISLFFWCLLGSTVIRYEKN